MDAGLRFKETVSVLTLYDYGGVLYAGFFAGELVYNRYLVAFRLGPFKIHPQEHRRPVAGFGPAGAGIYAQYRVRRVGFIVEKRFEFKAVELTPYFEEVFSEVFQRCRVFRPRYRYDVFKVPERSLQFYERLYVGL